MWFDEGAPPPTRGWTHVDARRTRFPKGSPAHAGMDPCPPAWTAGRSRLPRPRGDGPGSATVAQTVPMAPPPTRGWTLLLAVLGGLVDSSPAHAGMDPAYRSRVWERLRLPRPRGDGPDMPTFAAISRAAPPPTRGWTLDRARRTVPICGSPAHAGMDPRRPLGTTSQARLPRPRGDGPNDQARAYAADPAPPPTRGWTPALHPRPEPQRGCPAHAGMDPTASRATRSRSRVPRPRGDGPAKLALNPTSALAPPPTRGWTLRDQEHARPDSGSPAHAGMDPSNTGHCGISLRLPCPRGGGPGAVTSTWGWIP